MMPPWRRLRARTRLTLWYVALLAGTLIGLGSLGLWLVRQELYANADDVLRLKAAAVVADVDHDDGRLSFDGFEGDGVPVAVGLDVVRIWDRDGRLIHQQGPTSDIPETGPAELKRLLASGDQYATVRIGGEGLRLYFQPIREAGTVIGAVQVGRSEAETDALLDRLRTLGLVGLLVGLGIAWAGGSFLATRVLRPVDRIARTAQRIGAEDLSLRLDPPVVDDEFGRLSAAFNGMIDRLERAFQRQQRFTADASHELRTPLAVIRSLAEVALTSPQDDAYDRRVYTSIAEESERLGRLVESLLVLARADEGHAPTLGPLDVDEVMLDAAALVVLRARQQDVTLTVAPGEGYRVRGDASLLTQLVLNLLDNALRHTPPGGRVTLSLTPAATGVALSVADTGSGIAPEHLPRLFERFYRVDRARSRATGGFGLGLAICEWIARVHGGRLTVESEVGVGTIARVWLPRAPEPSSDSARLGGAPPGRAGTRKPQYEGQGVRTSV